MFPIELLPYSKDHFPTGSRVICNPPVLDTDEDWDTGLDVTVVTMEKLTKLKANKQRHISHHFDIRWNRAFAKPKDKQEERMFDVLHALQKEGHSIDMHPGNVMLRGDQPVIVDPAI